MKFFRNQDARTAQNVIVATAIGDGYDGDKVDAERIQPTATDIDQSSQEKSTEDVQAGVKKVEAVTLIWTKKELIFAYFW